MKKRCEEEDNKLKTDLERKDVKESKDMIKKIWMEKLKQESDLQSVLMKTQFPNQQAAQSAAIIGKTRVLDHIYITYGTKLHYLMHALEHYDLLDDKEIKTFEKSMQMEEKRAME